MKAPHLHSKAKAHALVHDGLKERGISYKAFIAGYEDRDMEVSNLRKELSAKSSQLAELNAWITSFLNRKP